MPPVPQLTDSTAALNKDSNIKQSTNYGKQMSPHPGALERIPEEPEKIQDDSSSVPLLKEKQQSSQEPSPS